MKLNLIELYRQSITKETFQRIVAVRAGPGRVAPRAPARGPARLRWRAGGPPRRARGSPGAARGHWSTTRHPPRPTAASTCLPTGQTLHYSRLVISLLLISTTFKSELLDIDLSLTRKFWPTTPRCPGGLVRFIFQIFLLFRVLVSLALHTLVSPMAWSGTVTPCVFLNLLHMGFNLNLKKKQKIFFNHSNSG